jgi:hypothetical protein
MNSNRMMEQVMAVFNVFMVLFYLGVGVYIVFFFNFTTIDKALRVILGSAFIFYGLYRAVRTIANLKELFFSKSGKEEEGNLE